MAEHGYPVTREAYIAQLYGKYPPDEEWTPEHELQLPLQLREGYDPND